MPWALHGTRYIRSGAEELVRLVTDELHYLDYEEARLFYDRFRQWTKSPKDYAFLAANDRYFLTTVLCGRRDALDPWIYDRCREVEERPDGCLDLWSRYHYKSTLITFAGIIQEIIRDPEITISIFSHTKGIAGAFLRQIKAELETNVHLMRACPDVFWTDPRRMSPKWSEQDGLVVKRKGNPKEATIEAWGLVDGQPTGKHFRLLVYDDVVTKESVTSPEMVKKTTDSWETSDNLGVGEATRKWHCGTRWSFSDTYQTLIERKLFKVRLKPATHNGRKDGDPVFMTPEQWQHVLRTQRSTVAAQMLQNPAAGNESSFELSWLKPYEIRPTDLNVYIVCDPSAGRKKTSDRTAIAVIGVDIAKNKYLLDGARHRMKLSERWRRIKDLHRKWSNARGIQFCYVGYETYGQQGEALDQFNEWMTDEKYSFPIQELTKGASGEISKVDRVNRLQPDIEGGGTSSIPRLAGHPKFYFPSVVYQEGVGLCSWAFNTDTNQIDYTEINTYSYHRDEANKLIKTRTPNEYQLTILQKQVVRQEQPWRLVQAIKAIDEDRAVYDLTKAFFEELQFFPFRKGHDDLVDAVSRIYDMNPAPPIPHGSISTEIKQPEWNA